MAKADKTARRGNQSGPLVTTAGDQDYELLASAWIKFTQSVASVRQAALDLHERSTAADTESHRE